MSIPPTEILSPLKTTIAFSYPIRINTQPIKHNITFCTYFELPELELIRLLESGDVILPFAGLDDNT